MFERREKFIGRKGYRGLPLKRYSRRLHYISMGEGIQTANYPALRRVARAQLRYGRDSVLDTTALVHDSFIRAAESNSGCEEGGRALLLFAPRIMRQVVVDSIRRRNAQIHGGNSVRVPLETGVAATPDAQTEKTIAIRQALTELERLDQRLARVVELRFFQGMTDDEIGDALGITSRTVRRDWDKARLLLAHALCG
jgi:RNA polymerase sigma factor (TIGR02999 family)